MSSGNNESTNQLEIPPVASVKDHRSKADAGEQRNRYGRHATNPVAQNSLQNGQPGAATSRSSPMRRTDLQDENVTFETFNHNNGREFMCVVRNGKRFYLDDWHSSDWQPFPERWYNEGKLVPSDNATRNSNQNNDGKEDGKQEHDDREGFLKHPRRGRIETYLMVEKRYVHYFFDRSSGKWLHLPIGWELHHDLVKQMVDYVQETLPDWKDRADILALLRACNYSPDECIGTYLLLDGDEWLQPKRTTKGVEADENMDQKIEELTQKLKKLESELELERKFRLEAEKQLADLEDKFSKVSVEATSAQRQMEAIQQSRPKTERAKTPRNSNQNNDGKEDGKQEHDDREGFLKHPRRGRIETYLMVEKRYVHYFFDRSSGKWLHLPIGWELHHDLVKQMVDYVEEALPNLKDRADILSLLRACNYSPDECIETYLLLEGYEWLEPKRTTKDIEADENKDQKIEELTQKFKKLACLFVNVSPDASNFPETCNTLDFGGNARQVALRQAKKNIQRKPGFPQK